MACILLWSSVGVYDSQAYRKMDVTRERISRILELREILCHSKLVSTLTMLLLSVLSWRVSLALTLISYNIRLGHRKHLDWVFPMIRSCIVHLLIFLPPSAGPKWLYKALNVDIVTPDSRFTLLVPRVMFVWCYFFLFFFYRNPPQRCDKKRTFSRVHARCSYIRIQGYIYRRWK